MSKGKLIVIEGLDGCGKGTNAEFVIDNILERGQKVWHTREPGGSPFAEDLREIILSKRHAGVPMLAELMIMYAARLDHIQNIILPRLNAGVNVVCERFFLSSLAYNKCAELDQVHAMCLPHLIEPDATIFLDIGIALSRERVYLRKVRQGAEPDRIEVRPPEYFEGVRANYHNAFSTVKNLHVIDAEQPLETVKSSVEAVLDELLGIP